MPGPYGGMPAGIELRRASAPCRETTGVTLAGAPWGNKELRLSFFTAVRTPLSGTPVRVVRIPPWRRGRLHRPGCGIRAPAFGLQRCWHWQ